MHIDRRILLDNAIGTIRRMAPRRINNNGDTTWRDVLDIPFLLWLTEKIVMLDPKTSCKIVGKQEEWEGLDLNKSLFHTPDGCGLPIGNLTSQLFSNVYLNQLPMNNPDKLFRCVNAMLGVLAHYDSHRLRHELFDTDAFHRVGYFDRDMTQFFLRRQ